jgi:hypothetical protein
MYRRKFVGTVVGAAAAASLGDARFSGMAQESAHLITGHPGGGTSSSQFFSRAPWLDFNMLHVGHYRFNGHDAEMVQHDYDSQPTRPVVDGETTCEDMPAKRSPRIRDSQPMMSARELVGRDEGVQLMYTP